MKRIFEIDNPDNFIAGKTTRLVTKGKKAILLPVDGEIIKTKGYIPHIKIGIALLKYCHACKCWLRTHNFIKNKHSADGYKDTCSVCDNKRRRERYAKTTAVT